MIKFLKDSQSIDFTKVLLLRAKELELSDQESYVLLLLLTFQEMGVKTITPQRLLEYSTLSNGQMDSVLSTLMQKQWIKNNMGSIATVSLKERLLQEVKTPVEPQQEIHLVEIFENEFGRSLSPMELSTIQSWKEDYNYLDETIIKALKEAVKSQVLSFRYMEAILHNWAKTGVSSRYVETPQEEEDRVISEYPWWQDE